MKWPWTFLIYTEKSFLAVGRWIGAGWLGGPVPTIQNPQEIFQFTPNYSTFHRVNILKKHGESKKEVHKDDDDIDISLFSACAL